MLVAAPARTKEWTCDPDFVWRRPSGYPGELDVPRDEVCIEGFVESVAQEAVLFGIGMAIVEPGGARKEFRYCSAHRHADVDLLENASACFPGDACPKNSLAIGDPKYMAARIFESVEIEPAPTRLVLGSQALDSTIQVLRNALTD